MIVTILGLVLHLIQTIGYLRFALRNPSPTMIILDLLGFVIPSCLLFAVSSFRFVLIEDFLSQQFCMAFNMVA